ncbi:MAG TPA: hypothetical protein VKR06_01280, partial [Ktedonosporobacter sp.]|nr:hypothetical protein [Ktedonosporobacter sp.]
MYDAWVRLKAPLKLAIGCCLAFFLWPGQLSAHTNTPVNLTLQVNVGFEATFREGDWTPVQISIQNNGADFSGTLAVSVVSGTVRTQVIGEVSPWSFEEPVTLLKGVQKQVTLYVPFTMGNLIPAGIIATLRDVQGKKVAEQTQIKGYTVEARNLFIGLLSDTDTNFDALTRVQLLNQTASLTTSHLTTDTMPDMAAALESFDVIILDDFSSNTLKAGQLAALQTWVNQGGVLIEVGGLQWQRTLSPLPTALLPVTVENTDTLPAGTHVWPFTGASSPTTSDDSEKDGLPTPAIFSVATSHPNNGLSGQETLLAHGATPLITQAHQGQGAIYFLAFDIGGKQLSTWPGVTELWTRIFTHAFGDKLLLTNTTTDLLSGPGRLLTHGGVLNMIEPPTFPGPWIIGVLLLGYLMMLGPVRLLILHWFKLPKWWGWRICAASVVVFSLLAYGLAQYQRGSLLSNDSISLIQMNQGGSSAHTITYMGLFVPSEGNFSVHISGQTLTQPIGNQFLSPIDSLSNPATTLTSGTNESNLILHDLGPWTFHPLVSEQDLQLHGSLL